MPRAAGATVQDQAQGFLEKEAVALESRPLHPITSKVQGCLGNSPVDGHLQQGQGQALPSSWNPYLTPEAKATQLEQPLTHRHLPHVRRCTVCAGHVDHVALSPRRSTAHARWPSTA